MICMARVNDKGIFLKIKFCGMHRQQDVDFAIQLGVDALGFVFAKQSKRYISPFDAGQLIQSLPPFVTSVGLFVNQSFAEVSAVLTQANVNVLQFHGDEDNAFCAQFNQPFIKAIRVKSDMDVNVEISKYPDATAILLDAYDKAEYGGTGKSFDWAKHHIDSDKPIMLAGGLNADNVCEAVSHIKPYAVDVSSGIEAAAGVKSRMKMQAFVGKLHLLHP